MCKLTWYQYLLLILSLLLLILQGAVLFNKPEKITREKPAITLLRAQPVPIKIASNSAQAITEENLIKTLSAQSLVAIDVQSGAILLEKNSHQAAYPASTTKMMTALIAKNLYPLDEVLTVTKEAFTTGNTMGLSLGEKITVKNLLAGLLINSGNDAAFALANHHPATYQGFVEQMNQQAQILHLDQTTFNNPSGLDKTGHQSSAFDLAILAKELIKDDYLRELVATQSLTVTDVDQKIKHQLTNTNPLLGKIEGIQGIKTGTTDLAGEVLVSLINRQSHPVLIVVMGSQDRSTDSKKIIDWIFTNYQWLEVEN